MPSPDASRIQFIEQGSTFRECDLEGVVREIDFRFNWANVFYRIIRDVNGLISETQYFSDEAKTQLVIKREVQRDPDCLISGIITTFYNKDDTIDSRVSSFMSRTSGVATSGCCEVHTIDCPPPIDCVSSYFGTGEDIPC